MRYALRHVLRERAAPLPYAALLMRALVLLLIILLLVFVGLMHLTGRYDVGGPVIGGILLISFIAANCAR